MMNCISDRKCLSDRCVFFYFIYTVVSAAFASADTISCNNKKTSCSRGFLLCFSKNWRSYPTIIWYLNLNDYPYPFLCLWVCFFLHIGVLFWVISLSEMSFFQAISVTANILLLQNTNLRNKCHMSGGVSFIWSAVKFDAIHSESAVCLIHVSPCHIFSRPLCHKEGSN